jgi:hypothetical protein
MSGITAPTTGRTIISGTGITFDTGESTDITLQLTCPAPGVLAFASRVDSEGQTLPSVLSGVGFPTQSDHAANRNYVDIEVNTVKDNLVQFQSDVGETLNVLTTGGAELDTQVQAIDTNVQGITTQIQTLNGAVTSMGNGTALIKVNEVDCVTLNATSDVVQRTIIRGSGITFDENAQITCPRKGLLRLSSVEIEGGGDQVACALAGVGAPEADDHAANRIYVDNEILTLMDQVHTNRSYVDNVQTEQTEIVGRIDWQHERIKLLSDFQRYLQSGDADMQVHALDSNTLAVADSVTVASDVTVGGHLTAATVTSTSDRRLKDNIRPLSRDRAVDILRRLVPVTYTWRQTGEADVGFIAQDVRVLLPELVHEAANGFLSMDYGKITAALVAAWQHADDTCTSTGMSQL